MSRSFIWNNEDHEGTTNRDLAEMRATSDEGPAMSSDTPIPSLSARMRDQGRLFENISFAASRCFTIMADEAESLERQLSALRAERDEARESAHDLNADLTAAEQRCATLEEERDGQLTEIRRLADFVRQVLGEAFSREELRNEARLILNNLSSGGPSK